MDPFIGRSSQWGRGDEREPVALPPSIAFVPTPGATEPAATWADTVPVYEGRPCLSSATLTQGAASIILVLQILRHLFRILFDPHLSYWEQSREKWEFAHQRLAKQPKGTDAGFNGLRSEQTQQTISQYDR